MADAMLNAASLAYAESFPIEDEIVTAARERGHELGCVPIGAGRRRGTAGAGRGHRRARRGRGRHRRRRVRAVPARPAWPTDGVLTTVDIESEHQRAAKQAFSRGRHRHHPLPADQRLGARGAAPAARRRLRPGVRRRRQERVPGLLRAGAAAAAPRRRGRVRQRAVARPGGRPAQRDPDTSALRDLVPSRSATTSGCSARCCQSATDCWSPPSGDDRPQWAAHDAVSERSERTNETVSQAPGSLAAKRDRP